MLCLLFKIATAPIEMSSGAATLKPEMTVFQSLFDQNNQMYSYVGSADTNICYSNKASMFGVGDEVCEAHQDIDEYEVCALV